MWGIFLFEKKTKKIGGTEEPPVVNSAGSHRGRLRFGPKTAAVPGQSLVASLQAVYEPPDRASDNQYDAVSDAMLANRAWTPGAASVGANPPLPPKPQPTASEAFSASRSRSANGVPLGRSANTTNKMVEDTRTKSTHDVVVDNKQVQRVSSRVWKGMAEEEELQYGPGIVNKLKSRYLSRTLRERPAGEQRRPSLRRATSLENWLDKDVPEADPPARQEVRNSEVRKIERPKSLQPQMLTKAQPPHSKGLVLKKTQSVDSFSQLARRSMSVSDLLSPESPDSSSVVTKRVIISPRSPPVLSLPVHSEIIITEKIEPVVKETVKKVPERRVPMPVGPSERRISPALVPVIIKDKVPERKAASPAGSSEKLVSIQAPLVIRDKVLTPSPLKEKVSSPLAAVLEDSQSSTPTASAPPVTGGQGNNGKSRRVSTNTLYNVEEGELPAPDTVRQVKRLFEGGSGRKPSQNRRSHSAGPVTNRMPLSTSNSAEKTVQRMNQVHHPITILIGPNYRKWLCSAIWNLLACLIIANFILIPKGFIG